MNASADPELVAMEEELELLKMNIKG